MSEKPKTESKTPNNSEENLLKSCFIVTPIGEPGSEINQKAFGLINAVMKPVLEEFNYKPIAASDISSPGSINKQIIIRLYEDELVVANLTGLNPNVMYELAVRHAVKKPVIIMAEKGTKLPFDLVDQRCIFYEDNLFGVELAKVALKKFLDKAIANTEVTNPIYDSIKESQILKKVTTPEDPSKYLLERFDRLERFLLNQMKSTDGLNDGNSYQKHPSERNKMLLIETNDKNPKKVIEDLFPMLKESFPGHDFTITIMNNTSFSLGTDHLGPQQQRVLKTLLLVNGLTISQAM